MNKQTDCAPFHAFNRRMTCRVKFGPVAFIYFLAISFVWAQLYASPFSADCLVSALCQGGLIMKIRRNIPVGPSDCKVKNVHQCSQRPQRSRTIKRNSSLLPCQMKFSSSAQLQKTKKPGTIPQPLHDLSPKRLSSSTRPWK